MSDPSLPTDVAELSALVVRLRATNSGLREVIAGQAEQMEALAARIAELERRLGSDSSTSSKPPSSDPPDPAGQFAVGIVVILSGVSGTILGVGAS